MFLFTFLHMKTNVDSALVISFDIIYIFSYKDQVTPETFFSGNNWNLEDINPFNIKDNLLLLYLILNKKYLPIISKTKLLTKFPGLNLFYRWRMIQSFTFNAFFDQLSNSMGKFKNFWYFKWIWTQI